MMDKRLAQEVGDVMTAMSNKITRLEAERDRLRSTGTGECYCDTLGETPCAYCQLQQAQEKLGHLEGKASDNDCPYLADKIQAEAERNRAVGALTAEVGRGYEWDEKYDAAIERAEAAETLVAELGSVMTEHCNVVDLDDMPKSLRQGFETAERDATEQRALAEIRASAIRGLAQWAQPTPSQLVEAEWEIVKEAIEMTPAEARALKEGDDG